MAVVLMVFHIYVNVYRRVCHVIVVYLAGEQHDTQCPRMQALWVYQNVENR